MLEPNEIFVFGSNTMGKHNGGAAKFAKDRFGAVMSVSEGLTGQTYAFPTLRWEYVNNNNEIQVSRLDVYTLKDSVRKLYKCAKENPDKVFLLTKVGCGIAGYDEKFIRSLFKHQPKNILKPRDWYLKYRIIDKLKLWTK